jgi:hypothetical protein
MSLLEQAVGGGVVIGAIRWGGRAGVAGKTGKVITKSTKVARFASLEGHKIGHLVEDFSLHVATPTSRD